MTTKNYTFYTIKHKDQSIHNVYFGYTKNFKKTCYHHKSVCNDGNKSEKFILYDFINDHGGFSNFTIKILSKQPRLTGLEARVIQQIYLNEEESNLLLNMKNPYRSNLEKLEQLRLIRIKKWKCESCNVILLFQNKTRHCRCAFHLKTINELKELKEVI